MAVRDAFSRNVSRTRTVLVTLMVFFITLFYYATVPGHIYYHTLFRNLYFLPLVFAGIWFGLRAAVAASLAITALYVPFVVMNWEGFSVADFSRVMEVVVFNGAAVILGLISEREKRAQKSLRESESLAAMGKALSAAAHDMKSPLIAIGGFARLVHKKLKEDDESREKLATVIKEVDRLEAMVREMLDFSRPLRLDLARGDLNKLLRESLVIVEHQAREKNVTLKADLSASLPQVEFDALRMEQVLINLLVNALQASPEGEKIFLLTYQEGDRVCLEIADHGPGLPREDRDKIFSPFYTTKREGTGLGLPIVLKILNAHGGNLEVLETGEKGATFRVCMPLKRS